MRENGIGINRGKPLFTKRGFPRTPSGERCGTFLKKGPRIPKNF